MPTIIMKANIDLDDEIDKYKEMHKRTRDFRPLFRDMRDDLADRFKENFLSNGSLVGGWAPLDKEYGAWKSAHFPGAPPMIRTGKLFTSLAELRGNPNEINRRSATFGTNVKYADFHQYGTTKMPRREIVFEPIGFMKHWSEKASDYLNDAS